MTTRFTQTAFLRGGRTGLGTVSGYPCSGYITTLFGAVDRLHAQGHTGLDIGGVGEVTPVLAPAAGRVKFVSHVGMSGWESWVSTYGNSVILEHADCLSLYAHLSTVSVAEGMSVLPGTRLGVTGNTGYSSGAHLHWAVAEKGNPWFQRDKGLIDPLSRIGADPALSPELDPEDGAVWNGIWDAVADGKVIAGKVYRGTEGTYKRLPPTRVGWRRYEFEIKG